MLTIAELLFLGTTLSLLLFLVGGLSRNAIVLTGLLRTSLLLGVRTTALLSLSLLPILTAFRYLLKSRHAPAQVQDTSSESIPGPLRPLIFPSKTTHTRFVPKKHGFGYSYLLVGIPIGWQGQNKILSVDGYGSRSWFSVRAADYLSRDPQSSLREKLAVYLSSQGDSLEHYAHAYLVTAPRFLGYVFNPVSFWYLFSEDLKLTAMILEVNNTFDERRMYFMKRELDASIDSTVDEPKFKHTWSKDFHVSPFNSRKGDYSLAAINPFASIKHGQPNIDNVITLRSSKGDTKLVARVFSTSTAVDPTVMTTTDTAILLLHWFWVGFLTFPRILFQAGRLYFQHKLHVWYRPEVEQTSIGRQPSRHEVVIEHTFQAFLESHVKHSYTPVSWKYTPPTGSASDTRTFDSRNDSSQKVARKYHTLHILTPQFYTWLVAHQDPGYFIDYHTGRRSGAKKPDTYHTSSQSSLIELLCAYGDPPNAKVSWSTSLHSWILVRLREIFQGKPFPHPLDRFVLEDETLTTTEKNEYFQTATTIQLVENVAGGFYPLVDALMLVLQSWFTWEIVNPLVGMDREIMIKMASGAFAAMGTNAGSIVA